MAHTVEELLNMTDAQLDELFTNGTVGDIPDGQANGTAIVANGTNFSDDIAHFVNFFAWQGKTFDAAEWGAQKPHHSFRNQRDHRQGL